MRVPKYLAAICVTVGLTTAYAEAPAQAVGCHQSTCTGEDPKAQGCSTSSTLTLEKADAIDKNGGFPIDTGDFVELRYSAAAGCGAFWARSYPDANDDIWTISADRKIDQGGGSVTSISTSGSGPGNGKKALIYTRMWGRERGFSYRACISAGGGFGCTSWVEG